MKQINYQLKLHSNYQALLDFEKKYKIVFPEDYKEFMKVNGAGAGITGANIFKPTAIMETSIDYFYGFSLNDKIEVEGELMDANAGYGIELIYKYEKSVLGNSYIPIGGDSTSSFICIGVKGEKFGKIYYWFECEDEFYLVANSFTEFIENLY